MANQITNYQCPNCGGPLHYAGESSQLECDYCQTKFDVAVIEQLYADKEQAAAAAKGSQWDFSALGGGWSEGEATRMRAYSCPSCAAAIICDDTTAATSCPYCGNPTVVPQLFAGGLKPDYVIPFKLDQKAATEALKKYYKGKRLLPKSFAEGNHVDEIKGVYVPFWLYDGEADASIRFHGTRVSTHERGDYRITETDHFRVIREGSVAFEKVPVDGSSKMPDAHMDAVEPFDYAGLQPFSSAYLPGFLAEVYDEDAEFCSKRADQRIVASTEQVFASTVVGYTSLTREYADISLKKNSVKYALLPVWMLSTRWKGKSFLFAMNGQTGKLIGDLPFDKGRYWSWFFRIWTPIAALLAIWLFLL